jgi:hypothetical protein
MYYRKMSTNYSQRHILDFELLFIITSDTEIIARVKEVMPLKASYQNFAQNNITLCPLVLNILMH